LLKLSCRLPPDVDGKVLSVEIVLKGQLRYVDLPHGEVVTAQDYVTRLQETYVEKYKTAKEWTDAELVTLIKEALGHDD
jgi:hypothetical protein